MMSRVKITGSLHARSMGARLVPQGLTSKLFWGLAALALGQALQEGYGNLTFHSLIWLSLTLLCVCVAVAFRNITVPLISGKMLWSVLLVGLAIQIYQLFTTSPGGVLPSAAQHNLWQFQLCIALAGIFAFLSLVPDSWLPAWVRIASIILTLTSVLLAGIWVIRAFVNPAIDVFMFQQTSAAALLHGRNPYELTPPNIYGDLSYYGTALVKDGKLTIGNPYPPLSIYLSTLGFWLTGDIRYTFLVAILGAGALMLSLRTDHEAILAAYLFLFTPRLYYVLEFSWTEPLVLFLVVLVIWCGIHRPKWTFIAFGLLMAIKQYMLFLFPLIILLNPAGSLKQAWARSVSQTLGSATVVTAPLAIWNFPAFFWDVGLAQWYQVPRIDALSYAAAYARISGHFPTQLLPFTALGLVLVWACFRGERSPYGFISAAALALVLFFALSKQAFCNYYFLVLGMACCAMATFSTTARMTSVNDYQ